MSSHLQVGADRRQILACCHLGRTALCLSNLVQQRLESLTQMEILRGRSGSPQRVATFSQNWGGEPVSGSFTPFSRQHIRVSQSSLFFFASIGSQVIFRVMS